MSDQVEKCFTFEPGELFTKEWRKNDADSRVESELGIVALRRLDTGQVELHARNLVALDHEKSDMILSQVTKFMNEKNYEMEQYEAAHVAGDGRMIHIVVNIEEM